MEKVDEKDVQPQNEQDLSSLKEKDAVQKDDKEENEEEKIARLEEENSSLRKKNEKLLKKKHKAIQRRQQENEEREEIDLEAHTKEVLQKIEMEKEILSLKPDANIEAIKTIADVKEMSLMEAAKDVYGDFTLPNTRWQRNEPENGYSSLQEDIKKKLFW